MNWTEFLDTHAIKHSADLSIGDIVMLDNGDHFETEQKKFIRVVCDGQLAHEQFYGHIEATGRRIAWCRNDIFKVVGKTIKI